MSNKSKEKHAAQAIAIINNLIIPTSEKVKLQTIARKLYQSLKLTKEETTFWNSFSNSEKSYILTGVIQHNLLTSRNIKRQASVLAFYLK